MRLYIDDNSVGPRDGPGRRECARFPAVRKGEFGSGGGAADLHLPPLAVEVRGERPPPAQEPPQPEPHPPRPPERLPRVLAQPQPSTM